MYMWYQGITIINLSIMNFVLLLQRCPIWTLAVFIGYDFLIGWFSSTKHEMERSMTVSDDHLALWRFPRLCVSWNITFTNDDEQGWVGFWVFLVYRSSRWEILQLYQDYLVYFVTNARTDIMNNQVIPTGLGYISGNLN